MRKYKDSQVALMRINPYHDGQLSAHYAVIQSIEPHLQLAEEKINAGSIDPVHVDYDTYFRYLSFIYDPATPIKETDLLKRKAVSAQETGYSAQEYHQIAAIYIMRVLQAESLSIVYGIEHMMVENMETMLKPITGLEDDKFVKTQEVKSKIPEQQIKLLELKRTLLSRIFLDDADVINTEESNTMAFTPESAAKMLRRAP